jgi:lipopolysaccharide transport system permease protein
MINYTQLVKSAFEDIGRALNNHHQIVTLGWQDVATRYRRSVIGAFWLTINKAVLIAAIGLVFGTLFGQPMAQFLPHVAIGLIVWGFISSTMSSACGSFIVNKGIILQINLPLYTHLMRDLWHETIILAHNIVIIPILLIVLQASIDWHVILVIPGFTLLVLNLVWISLVLAVLCTRYRDVTQIVQNVLQVLFYLTPIIWNAHLMPDRVNRLILEINPFFHMLEVIREPILGTAPGMSSWIYLSVMAVVGWAFALPFFGFFRRRIAYWL